MSRCTICGSTEVTHIAEIGGNEFPYCSTCVKFVGDQSKVKLNHDFYATQISFE